jgi:hypothetical protein
MADLKRSAAKLIRLMTDLVRNATDLIGLVTDLIGSAVLFLPFWAKTTG